MRAFLVKTKDGTMFAAMASVKFKTEQCGECGNDHLADKPYIELHSVGMADGPVSALCDIKGWRTEIEALVLEQWKKASP